MEIATEASSRPNFLKSEDGVLLTSYEADHIVGKLTCFDIKQVGSANWLEQQKGIEKLNVQAHYNAIAHCNDYVMEALISHEKMGVLIHELLVMEIWKEKIFPYILQNLGATSSTLVLSLILAQESSIINMFEVILFHCEAWEAFQEDALLELADYCSRKLCFLNSRAKEDLDYNGKDAKAVLNQSASDEVNDKVANLEFACGICVLTIIRYMTDNVSSLPLSTLARLIATNDVIMALVPLIDYPPWERKRHHQETIVKEKYIDGKWVQLSPEDYFKLTKPEAQVWMSLNNLLVEKDCRTKYDMDSYRRDQVLKLRKYLNDLLIDQLYVLRDLKWVLEELAIKRHSTSYNSNSKLILEHVPKIRMEILHKQEWGEIAKMQWEAIFNDSKVLEGVRHQQFPEMIKMFEFGALLDAPKCTACGAQAVQRCSRCKMEWYCGRTCQVANWQAHKKLCEMLSIK